MDMFHMTDSVCNRSYLMDTQDRIIGGFAKWPDNTPGRHIQYLEWFTLICRHCVNRISSGWVVECDVVAIPLSVVRPYTHYIYAMVL